KLDPEFLVSLFLPCLLCAFLKGLVDTQPSALGLGRESRQSLAEAQALVFVKSESLGHDRCPERQDRRSVDGYGLRGHVCSVLVPNSIMVHLTSTLSAAPVRTRK